MPLVRNGKNGSLGAAFTLPSRVGDGLMPHCCGTISPIMLNVSGFRNGSGGGTIFIQFDPNAYIMNNILFFMVTVLGAYLCTVCFVLVLVKLIFPWQKEEDLVGAESHSGGMSLDHRRRQVGNREAKIRLRQPTKPHRRQLRQ